MRHGKYNKLKWAENENSSEFLDAEIQKTLVYLILAYLLPFFLLSALLGSSTVFGDGAAPFERDPSFLARYLWRGRRSAQMAQQRMSPQQKDAQSSHSSEVPLAWRACRLHSSIKQQHSSAVQSASQSLEGRGYILHSWGEQRRSFSAHRLYVRLLFITTMNGASANNMLEWIRSDTSAPIKRHSSYEWLVVMLSGF